MVVATAIPSAYEQVLTAYNASKGLFQTETKVADSGPGEPRGVVKANRLTVFNMYHAKYNDAGRIVDWHIDKIRTDPNGLIARLNQVYTEGKGKGLPVRYLTLPEGATRPENTVGCAHPDCEAKFQNEAMRMQHYFAAHRDWWTMEKERVAHDERTSSTEGLQEQVESLSEAVKLLAQIAAQGKGGK
jgi:hypothetical protein